MGVHIMKPIKGFLPSHVKASREKKENSSSHSLSLSLSLHFFLSLLFLLIPIDTQNNHFATTDLVIVATFHLIFVTFTLAVHPLVATHHHSWSSLLHTRFIVMDVSHFLSHPLRSLPCHPFCFTLRL